jgi:predicted DNA binding CopG/RHH family protein
MRQKQSALSRRVRRIEESAPQPPDSEIDFSDLPELTDEQLTRMRRVGRPLLGNAVKKSIAIRINPNLLAELRLMAARKNIPYQTLIHDILEKSVARASQSRTARRS